MRRRKGGGEGEQESGRERGGRREQVMFLVVQFLHMSFNLKNLSFTCKSLLKSHIISFVLSCSLVSVNNYVPAFPHLIYMFKNKIHD